MWIGIYVVAAWTFVDLWTAFCSLDECGQAFYDQPYASIFSPSWPENYSSGLSCTYEIESHQGQLEEKWLLIWWFKPFDIDGTMPLCEDDYIEVSVGCGDRSKLVSRFCSRNAGIPHEIVSTDNCATIVFRSSSGSKGGKGFGLHYESRSKATPYSTTECSRYESSTYESGLIVTPQWPNPMDPLNFPQYTCLWHIDVDDSKQIKVNIMDIDLVGVFGSCYQDLRDEVVVTGYVRRSFCAGYRPTSLSDLPNGVDIKVTVGYSTYISEARGVAIGYISYGTEVEARSSKRAALVIGLSFGGSFFLFGVLSFVCWMHKRSERSRTRRTLRSDTFDDTPYTAPLAAGIAETELPDWLDQNPLGQPAPSAPPDAGEIPDLTTVNDPPPPYPGRSEEQPPPPYPGNL